jgi:nucleotidyltransferase/DNA polymerase involved in DNA repair
MATRAKTSATQSAVDTLHRLFCAELTLRLQAGDASAAVLNTVGAFLKASGMKPTQDSPAFKRLTAAYDLPFRTDDTPQLPTPNQKDQ